MECKKCPGCKNVQDINQFEFKDKYKIGRSSWCRTCNREYKKKHYLKNKDRYVSAAEICNNKRRLVIRKAILDYLKDHPCVDCGESDPVVLEFDHRDPTQKVAAISKLRGNRCDLDTIIKKEIEKCDVRCANCHRRKTAKQFNWYESYEKFFNTQKRKRRNPKKEEKNE